METIWYAIVWGMLAMYVILDGIDFGAGILHLSVAKTDSERRTVLAAIGPIWSGNEVWLIASGGLLFMAFPRVYATVFSGFYLALMVVLWLLILRGVAIEFRRHQKGRLGRQFWDVVFAIASLSLATAFGATLGNLVRGVPLDRDGLPGLPLFTNFQPWGDVGAFDWYTLLIGGFAACSLAMHGATFLVWRTSGELRMRSRASAVVCWRLTAGLWGIATAATTLIWPALYTNIFARPWAMACIALAFLGLLGVIWFLKTNRELLAFLSSCAFLLGMLGATMSGIYPVWLRSNIDDSLNLTAKSTVAGQEGLRIALAWWSVGILLVAAYFAILFRFTRGKVQVDGSDTY